MTPTFTFAKSPDHDGFIVLSRETRARSFALVPVGHDWLFDTAAEAQAQAVALSGQSIQTRMIETPDRFEAVADTRYGPAW